MKPIDINELPRILAIKYAKKSNAEYEDLKQEGEIGLIEARKTYDASRGKEISYCYHCVRGRILKYLALLSRTVRLPYDLYYKYGKRSKKGFKRVADAKVIFVEKKGEKVNLIDTLKGDDDFSEKLLSNCLDKIKVEKLLKYIKLEKHKKIVIMFFGLDNGEQKTLRQVADKFSLTHQGVSYALNRALNEIRAGVKYAKRTNARRNTDIRKSIKGKF